MGTKSEDKIHLIVALSDDLTATGLNASKLVKEVSPIIQGGGGGQPSLATAGGKNRDGLEKAIEKIVEVALSQAN